MKEKYGLLHWDNSLFKTWLIICYTAVKNRVFIVYDNNRSPVATFCIGVFEDYLHFGKLAVLPEFSGKGIGSFCLKYIERLARQEKEKAEKTVYAVRYTKKASTRSAFMKNFLLKLSVRFPRGNIPSLY